ncbi:MAG: peptidylprolyl isomerase [Candidatus Sumerlaeaceae bacterium]|nr:peptidylprolyl isomerase [Candidatus Sumerlaeaceae bacterium]
MRKLKRSRKSAEEIADERKIPKGVYWTFLAVLLVVGVWQYDQRQQKIAHGHMRTAETLERKADYLSAIAEYRRAMENPRISRKEKAELALKIAGLYDTKLDDPELALAFYNRARRFHPRTTDKPEVKAKMAELREKLASRSLGELYAELAEPSTEETSAVRLLAPPPEDLEGELVAKVGGAEVRAGAVARFLEKRGILAEPVHTLTTEKLSPLLEEFLDRELAYRAAIASGIHMREGVLEQIYDYQRTLLSQQFLKEEKDKAQMVSEEEIKAFYEKYKRRFYVPVRTSVGAIAATTETAILEAQRLYENGAKWQDLATTYTDLAELMPYQGMLTILAEDDIHLPIIGEAKELAQELKNLDEGKTLGPKKINDHYWLFVVLKRFPGEQKSLDEVRSNIEMTLRSEKVARDDKQLKEQLRKQYNVSVTQDAPSRLLEYLRKKQNVTTATVAGTGASPLQD